MPRAPDNTALLRAAEHGSVRIVAFLLRNGFYINDAFDYGPRDGGSPFDPTFRSPLRMAVRSGNSEVVAFLLRNGASLNTSRNLSDKKRGVSELHLAAEYGRADIAVMLLRHGAKAEKPCRAFHPCLNRGGGLSYQAIHLAANKGHLDVVALLLRRDIPVDVTTENGRTALHLAAAAGHLPLVKFLVETASADIEGSSESESTPLLRALQHGHNQVARYLIQSGADVLVNDKSNGYGTLHNLARSGTNDLEIARELIRRGVSATAADREGNTPLSEAIFCSNVDMIQCFHEQGADVVNALNPRYPTITPLHLAANKGRIEHVKYFTLHGADHTAANEAGHLPIHHLARKGNVEGVRWIVENSGVANLMNALTTPGRPGHVGSQSILHIAATWKQTKVVSYLVGAGANVNALDEARCTPLYAAVRENARAIVALLLHNGAKLDAPGSDSSSSLLHCAARRAKCEVVALLVKYGADISARDPAGSTPLHIAARHSSKKILMFLLRRGANPNAINNEGLCPLHYAAQSGLKYAVEILLNHGADPSITDQRGLAPLHYAAATHVDLQISWLLLKASGLHWLEPTAPCRRGRT